METPIQKAKRLEEKAMTFSENYEEELKKQLFEETQNNNELDKETILQSETSVHKARPSEKWDVPITEEIKYFDPELSYEITGYRPITMESGLDFDPTPFKATGEIYDRTGKYTEFPKGTKKWREFWNKEVDRCKNGYTVGKYRITGDHYFFLNYYRMEVVKESSTAGKGRMESFPGFLSKQYEFFHYIEMAEKVKKDVCALKARGIGFSEILADLAVRPYTVIPNYDVIISCAADAKLAPLREKCWRQLDWLNMNTGGGMRHVRQVVNNNDTKRASKKTVDNVEFGWGSQIQSIVADTSDKVRGSRVDRLILDEGGSNPCLTESWIKGDALVALGGERFGTRFAVGTGGDDMKLEGLRTMFLNPRGYNILPYKNYDSDDGRPELTSFFVPAHKFALTSKYLDSRGVTNWPEFKKFYEEQRAKLSDNDYLNECAEHCFTPREALSKHGDNVFDAAIIAERIVQIKTQNAYTKPKHVSLLWDLNYENGRSKVIAKESQSSPLLVVEPPLTDDSGRPMKGLYVAGIDAIDMGRKDSASDSDVSDFCVVIKRRVYGSSPAKYVAMYKYRPNDIRQAYDLTMKLLTWYNCQAMLEYTKISIQTYFRDHGKENLLMARPAIAISGALRKSKSNKRLIGVPGTESMIRHGLELIANFLNDFWSTIDFEEMLDQLLNYSYANKRKFDIIASMQMAELGDEDMTGIIPASTTQVKNTWKDFGWYTDARGYKRYGVIPTNSWKA